MVNNTKIYIEENINKLSIKSLINSHILGKKCGLEYYIGLQKIYICLWKIILHQIIEKQLQ